MTAPSAGRILAAALAAGALLLAGCGSGGGLQVVGPSEGVEAGMIGPVVVDPDQTEATLEVGRILYFSVEQPIGTTLSTSDPKVLEVEQAGVEGDMVTAPTARALATGSAVITVTNPDGSTRDVAVAVSD